MKKFFATYNFAAPVNLAFLVLRLVMGYAFVMHGWGKIQTPTSWMGPDSFIPPFLQALAAVAEFVGGIALILGFLTRLAGFGLLITMLVAVYMHAFMLHDPFMNPKGGGAYELPLVYLSISLLLLTAGAGGFSIDKLVFGENTTNRLSY